MTTGPWQVVPSVTAAVAVSPLLACWSAALAGGQRAGWWRPRPVGLPRWACVAAVAAAMVLPATAGHPAPAWWLLAAGGAVLAAVDVQTHLLPARFTYPLAATITVALLTAAILGGDFPSLLRAMTAAVVVGGIWLSIRVICPPAMGMGDVRLAAVTGGLLGWVGWTAVWDGQLLIVFLAGITAIGVRIAGRGPVGGRAEIPVGPAIVVGSLLALWL